MDGVPANVAARIDSILSRFDPARLNRGSSTRTEAAASTPASSGFADVLASTVESASFDDGSITLDTTLGELVAAANLSRMGALGHRTRPTPISPYGAGVAGVGGAGAIASTAVVRELEGAYENGRLPNEALVSIGVGNHRLAPPAAQAFVQMQAAAEADGVEIGVTDSYRSYDAQVDVARRKGLYSQGGLAATPGTSDHGLGLALDLDLDANAQAWMRSNGAKFGFVEDTPREPWHWKFDGV